MIKSVLITGASRGLGHALLEPLAAEGYHTIGMARNGNGLHRTVKGDVRNVLDIQSAIKTCNSGSAQLWGLINNAGIAQMNHSLLTTEATLDRLYETNLKGTFIATREAIKRGAKRIINISTVAVPLALAGEAAYVATKGAVEALTRAMAREAADYGCTVNAIGPGVLHTGLTMNVPEEKLNDVRGKLIFPKCTFDDVAHVAKFLLDERAEHVTGQVVYIGGVW